MSGALVTGQTRISSSLASTDCPFQSRDERGVDARPDRQVPATPIGERDAFYRILLRHQDYRGVGELQFLAPVTMVVGEGVANRIEPESAQKIEEARRMADAGDGVDNPATPGTGVGHRLRPRQV